jgi:hypothetical protein
MATDAVVGSSIRKRQIRQVLEDPNSFGTCLLALFLDSYGTEAFEWEPETIRLQLKDDFGATLPLMNHDKLWGLIVAMTTNQFQLSQEIFAETCRALNGDEADFGVFSPADPEDLAWGVAEVVYNDPPDPALGNAEFSHEVARYTGLVLYNNGILEPPKFLQFAEYPRENPVLDLETAFVDDPDMFEAARQKQVTAKVGLEAYVQERMKQLWQQLQELPLLNRKKK